MVTTISFPELHGVAFLHEITVDEIGKLVVCPIKTRANLTVNKGGLMGRDPDAGRFEGGQRWGLRLPGRRKNKTKKYLDKLPVMR